MSGKVRVKGEVSVSGAMSSQVKLGQFGEDQERPFSGAQSGQVKVSKDYLGDYLKSDN